MRVFLRIADSQFLSGVTDTETGTGSGLGNSLFSHFFQLNRHVMIGHVKVEYWTRFWLFGEFLDHKVSNKIFMLS